MAKVAQKPLDVPPSPDGFVYYEQITFGSGSAGPKPQPPGGGGGGSGPDLPVDPGYSPPWAQVPGEGGGRVATVTMVPIPPSDPPIAPPAGMSPDAVQVIVFMGEGTLPTTGWINPYASTGPVPPPA